MASITLTGLVSSIRHVNPADGYVVFVASRVTEGGRPRADCKVVGRAKGLAVGEEVACAGAWETRAVGGRPQEQFTARSVERVSPAAPVEAPAPVDRPSAQTGVAEALAAVTTGGGHATTRRARLSGALEMTQGWTAEEAERAIDEAAARGEVVLHDVEGEAHVADAATHELEGMVADRLGALAAGRTPWDHRRARAAVRAAARRVGMTPSPSQERALDLVATSRVSVLTGGPGVGKTSVMSILVRALEGLGAKVALAALAAQAAERMKEATGRDATTIHLLLEANGVDGAFRRNASRPLDVDLVVVDESSMLDLWLVGALLDALPPHAAIVFAGDADQLRAVGVGQFLVDVIDSGLVPVARLTEVHRQAASSLIVHNSRRILEGKLPETDVPGLKADYREIVTASAAETREVVVALASGGLAKQGFGPRDVAVVSPQAAGEAGIAELNARLRQALNPGAQGAWAVDDRVMVTANDRKRRLRNGNVGTVVAVSRRTGAVSVDIDGRRVEFRGRELADLAPAYAVSVHKMQGSERRCVIVVVSNEHAGMLSRSLFMTAVTRGSELTIVVGQADAIRRAVASAERPRVGTLLARLRALAGDGVAVAA